MLGKRKIPPVDVVHLKIETLEGNDDKQSQDSISPDDEKENFLGNNNLGTLAKPGIDEKAPLKDFPKEEPDSLAVPDEIQ